LRLSWNDIGSRFFETGVDRGVLYVAGAPSGVVWNGITSVSEHSSGGDPNTYYLDGEKYLDYPTNEDFEFTLEAFTYPDEFGQCDGTAQVRAGLFVTQQMRKTFHLTYRSKVGSDLSADLGYKIHIIYNALASPSDQEYKSLQESADPTTFSWDVTTRPTVTPGYKPTAHVVIDSRYTAKIVLDAVENILYGTSTTPARMPSFTELVNIFDVPTLTVTDNGDGTYTVTGPDSAISMLSSDTFQVTWPTAEFIDADSYTISSS
jgi:hypothetical protein